MCVPACACRLAFLPKSRADALRGSQYGLNVTLLSAGADKPLLSTDLWATARQGWLFNGQQGVAVVLPTGIETIGSSRGLSFAVWFEADHTYSAINEGRNVILSATTLAGVSLRLTFASGMRLEPRLSLKVGRLSPANLEASETSSDYASSDRHFAPGTPNAGGSAEWQVAHLGRTWQHVVLSFAGDGRLTALYWNAKKRACALRSLQLACLRADAGALSILRRCRDGKLDAAWHAAADAGRAAVWGARHVFAGLRWRHRGHAQGRQRRDVAHAGGAAGRHQRRAGVRLRGFGGAGCWAVCGIGRGMPAVFAAAEPESSSSSAPAAPEPAATAITSTESEPSSAASAASAAEPAAAEPAAAACAAGWLQPAAPIASSAAA